MLTIDDWRWNWSERPHWILHLWKFLCHLYFCAFHTPISQGKNKKRSIYIIFVCRSMKRLIGGTIDRECKNKQNRWKSGKCKNLWMQKFSRLQYMCLGGGFCLDFVSWLMDLYNCQGHGWNHSPVYLLNGCDSMKNWILQILFMWENLWNYYYFFLNLA